MNIKIAGALAALAALPACSNNEAANTAGAATGSGSTATTSGVQPGSQEDLVANVGDRPIQVGSHYHFFEVNPGLRFDREKARGQRLDIAPGTAVRFEPGSTLEVVLVPLSGGRTVYGFRGDVMGAL